MLISITEKCRMGCSHCMDDARPDCENHMTREIFEKAVDFNFEYDLTITITGGEPTEHPQFWEFMDILVGKMESCHAATICTNGMNITDDDLDKVVALRKKCKGMINFQVSSFKPYYPIQIDLDQKIFKHEAFFICTKLEKLEKRGRAVNHPEWRFTTKAPQCFNLRSCVRSCGFRDGIMQLRSFAKFCTPQIAYDGQIKLGESCLCPPVGNIYDSESELTKKICMFTCKCPECHELLNKLPKQYKQAVGEL